MIGAARQVRRSFGAMAPARVREILELAEVPIEAEIARMSRALRRCGTVDADDLRSLGRIAALEAEQTFDPNRGGTLRTWIGTCVRWRIAETMQDAGDCASLEVTLGHARDMEVILVERPSGDRGLRASTRHPLVVEETATDEIALAECRAWVLRSLAGLSPRQKILLAQRLANAEDSDAELAETLGVDRTQVWRDFATAVAKLSARAHAGEAEVVCV